MNWRQGKGCGKDVTEQKREAKTTNRQSAGLMYRVVIRQKGQPVLSELFRRVLSKLSD